MKISPKIDKPVFLDYLFPSRNGLSNSDFESDESFSLKLSENLDILCSFFYSAAESPTLIIYPSTSEDLAAYGDIASGHKVQGVNVLILSYRNDNNKSKKIVLQEFFDDGHILFEQALSWLAKRGCKGPIFLMGRALSTVVVMDIAAKQKDSIKGLLLESPFYELPQYLESLGAPVDSISLGDDDNLGVIETIEEIKLPTLFFHGSKDELTPIQLAEKLQASCGARTKQFFIIPGAKSDDLQQAGGQIYYQTIKKFLDTVSGANTWRQKRKKYKKKNS